MPFLVFPMAMWFLILCGGFVLAGRLIRALENRGGSNGDTRALQERMARLEESLESMTSQLNRMDEAQQFTTRLLEGRKEIPSADSDVSEPPAGPGLQP